MEKEIFEYEVKGETVEVYYVTDSCNNIEETAAGISSMIPDGQKKVEIPLVAEIRFHELYDNAVHLWNDTNQHMMDLTVGLLMSIRDGLDDNWMKLEIINCNNGQIVLSLDELGEAYLYGSEYEAREVMDFLTRMHILAA